MNPCRFASFTGSPRVLRTALDNVRAGPGHRSRAYRAQRDRSPLKGTFIIVNQTRGTTVCEHAEIADNPWTRLRGLLGRDSLASDRGMLISPAPSIHSAFMRFDFDAVFLDREMHVVKISERIPPWRARSAKGARSVLELAAGEASRRGVQVGDELAVTTETGPENPAATTAL